MQKKRMMNLVIHAALSFWVLMALFSLCRVYVNNKTYEAEILLEDHCIGSPRPCLAVDLVTVGNSVKNYGK